MYLDNNNGRNYLAAGANPQTQVLIPIATKPGPHKLRVVLFNNDHSLYSPATEGSANFTVIDTKPKVIVKISNPKVKSGEKAKLTVTVLNFKLDANKMGKPKIKGEGHYHVYLDNNTGGNYLAVGASKTIEVLIPLTASPGKHTLRVTLMQNDHSPVQPAVQSSVAIDVVAGSVQTKVLCDLCRLPVLCRQNSSRRIP